MKNGSGGRQGTFGYPAKFAGVRRRPEAEAVRRRLPRRRKPSAARFELSDASETFSGAFLSFPRARKRSAARFDTFRGVGNVPRRVLTLSEASETFSGAFLSFPTRRKRSAARFDTFRGVRVSADTGEFGRGRQGRQPSLAGYVRDACRGVLHTPHQTTRYGANDHIRRPSIRACGPFDVGLLGAAPRWFVGAGTRVGAYCIRPTWRHHRWRIHVPGV